MTATNLIERRDGRLPLDQKQVATMVVNALLADEPLSETALAEASVHRPKRGRIWVACYTAAEGGQTWRSTGMIDHEKALRSAERWESEARAERKRLGLRARRSEPRPRRALLTQKEVAELLQMSERGVREAERRALQKLRSHPLLRQIWQRFQAGELDEHEVILTTREVAALFDLARTSEERFLIRKILRLLNG